MSAGWLAVPIRGKSVNDRSTEMRVNFKTIGGAQENVIKVIHRQRQLCKDFIIVNGVIAKLKTNSCKPTLKWTIKLKNTFVFRSFDLKKNADNLYSFKKENAVWLPSLRTLRQNNLAETSSSSQRLQQTLNKSIIPIRIKWQTHLSTGISTISTISRPNPLPWDGNPGWLDGWMALLDPHFLPSQLQDFASKLRLPPTANIPPNCTKDTALQNYFITACSSFL